MSPGLKTGRYEVLETLGSGATSRVDKARDTIIGRTVALKSFLQGFGKNSEQQFLSEAQTIGSLSHSSIAQLYDVNTDAAGAAFLVMEFVPGKNLEQLLAHGPIPFEKAAVWAADLGSALAHAQRAGIIHGDVKPSNIRVTEDEKVKLVDFGVARFASQVSGSDRVLGTPAYLSPEQIEGKKQDGRSDLFSLGVVLYEMITGVRPFAGDSLGEVCAQILTAEPIRPSKLNPSIPAALDRILVRCLAKNPDERYQSGKDLARALYLVARCGNHLSSQPKRAYWFMRQAHPRDLWAIASLVLLVASAVIAADSLRDWLQPRPASAVASVRAKSVEDLTFTQHTQAPVADSSGKQLKSRLQKTVPTRLTKKRVPASGVPEKSEVSATAPVSERLPLQK
ncbi:MAG TPA: serine/threonine-protein kinase [Candidatus Solibacter sp.]|nr:serine/threonine-protein kinase [Candidatus Solibacter sp.]